MKGFRVRSMTVVLAALLAGRPHAAAADRFDGWVSREPKDRRANVLPPQAGADPAAVCVARLRDRGIVARSAMPPPPSGECGVETPVHLDAIETDFGRLGVDGAPMLACAFAGDIGAFAREIVAPLAFATFGRKLQAVSAGGGYECRPRNRAAGAKPSAHGRGIALDISGFVFEDGTRFAIGPDNSEKRRAFTASLRKAACGYFSTALGPGSDAAHADHLHLDSEPRGRDGKSKFCQ